MKIRTHTFKVALIAVAFTLFGGAAYARYLEPEPMLTKPGYVKAMAQQGRPVPVYSYANNNPIYNTDPTGKYSWHQWCEKSPGNLNTPGVPSGFVVSINNVQPPWRGSTGTVGLDTANFDACKDCTLAKYYANFYQTPLEVYSASDCWRSLTKEICAACDEQKRKNKCESH